MLKGPTCRYGDLLARFACFVVAMSLGFMCPQRSCAQVSVTNVQTMGRYFLTWDFAADGNSRSCGYVLVGHFQRLGEYTSFGEYSLVVRDAQGRTPRLGWFKTSPGPGEDFAFDIGGTWVSGAAGPGDLDCPQPYSVAGLEPWTATLIIRPPGVSFTFSEAAWAPGRIQFQSGANDPKWKDLDLHWSFGDGSEGTSVNPVHEYSKPGTYRVVLKATNPPGAWNARTNTVVVNAPPLGVSLQFVDREDARPFLGETVRVRATVHAGRHGLGALTGLAFGGPTALEVPEGFRIESAPASTAIGSLQPGEYRDFDWTLKVVRAGRFTLRTTPVTGFDAANRPVTAQGTLPGEVSGLQVEVVFPEKPLVLEKKPQQPGQLSSQPGYEPATFPVKVKVSVPTNGEPVKNITLQGWALSDSGLDIDQMRATGNPQQPWVLMVPQPVPFPLTTQTKPPAATVSGPLGPKDKPIEFDFLVKAERPGLFQFASVFTASSVDGAVGFQERGAGNHAVLGDLVLSVQVAIANEPASIKEGQAVEVYGRVKNLTDNETILLDPIHIINSGQGVVLGPVEETADLPVVGSLGIFAPILTPEGDTKEASFKARVKTVRLPGLDQTILTSRTAVLLDFAVGGQVIGEDGEKRDIAPENMLVEWGNGGHPVTAPTHLRVPVQPDPLKARELAADEFFFRLYGNAAENLVEGGWEGIVGLGQFIASVPQLAWSVGSFSHGTTKEVAGAYLNSARYLWAYQQWLLAVNSGISPETRKAEIDAISAELKEYYGRKAESLDKVTTQANGAIQGFFSKVLANSRAAYDHDYEFNAETAKVLTDWVQPAAKFVTEEALVDLATGMFLTRVARSAKVADDLAAAAKKQVDADAGAVEAATAAIARGGDDVHPGLVGSSGDLRNLRGGAVVEALQAIRGWAVDKVTDANLVKLTKDMPIVVAVRSRADETLEWMQTKLGMTPKPVTMKPKNVDLIDVEFLGYRQGSRYGDELGRGGGDRGSVVLAEPLPPAAIQQRLAGVSPEVREEVIKRYRQRWEEWYGKGSLPPDESLLPFDDTVRPGSKVFELKFKANHFVAGDTVNTRTTLKGSLPVPKRGSVPDPSINSDVTEAIAGESFEPRRLELRQVIDPPGNEHFAGRDREYYEVWLEDETQALRRVAGDVDVVVVADVAGYKLGLNPLKATIKEYGNKVARLLQHVMKAQHPWSSSLIPDKMRAEYLDAHRWHPDPKKRGEPLLLYFNGERRVGWFHPTKNIDPENPLADFLFLDGGPGSVDDVVRGQVADRNSLPEPETVAPKFINTAKTAIRAALIDNDYVNKTTLLATCAIGVGRNSGAALYRLSEANILQQRLPDGTWAATTPTAECGAEGIVIVPETVISEDVVAGVLRIPIIEELLGTNWKQLFQIGDDILIAPGTPWEESNTIAGHGSLLLARPLRFSHPAGTQIVLLPPVLRDASILGAPPIVWLRADAGLQLDGNNVLRWLDQSSGVPFDNGVDGNPGFPTLIPTDLGLPAVRFHGDEWLSGSLPRTLNNATIFTLARFNIASSTDTDYLYAIGAFGSSGSMMSLARDSANDAYHSDGKTVSMLNGAFPAGGWQVLTQVYGEGDARDHQLFRDGQLLLETTAAEPYRADASRISLGNYYDRGSRYLIGDIAEWMLFDRILSPAERTATETYLAKRAGLFRPEPSLTLSVLPAASGAGRWILAWPGEPTRQYHLERSTTLQPGSWILEQTITPASKGTVEIEIEVSPGQREGVFYRLRSN